MQNQTLKGAIRRWSSCIF